MYGLYHDQMCMYISPCPTMIYVCIFMTKWIYNHDYATYTFGHEYSSMPNHGKSMGVGYHSLTFTLEKNNACILDQCLKDLG